MFSYATYFKVSKTFPDGATFLAFNHDKLPMLQNELLFLILSVLRNNHKNLFVGK